MTATATQRNALGLPPPLRAAQPAVRLTEVQDMLRGLSVHGLGIYMPHTHDENTGEFQPFPDQLMQVKVGLEVSFRPTAEIATPGGRFLPVTWVWRDGMSMPASVCEMVQDEDASDDEEPTVKRKMPTRNGSSSTSRPASWQRQQPMHVKATKETSLIRFSLGAAKRIIADLGVTSVPSDVLPGQKAAKIKDLQARGKRVGMVGDGVNNAPALSEVNVGFAIIDAGTDVAMDSADVVLVLMKRDLYDIVGAIELSRAILHKMHQNLWWAAVSINALLPQRIKLAGAKSAPPTGPSPAKAPTSNGVTA